MKRMIEKYFRLPSALSNEKGQTMVEYALIIALIAVLLVGGITALQGGIGATFTTITGSL